MKRICGITILLVATFALCLFLNAKKTAPAPGTLAITAPSNGQPANSPATQNNSAAVASVSSVNASSALSPGPPLDLATNAGTVQSGAATVPSLDIPPEIVLQNVRRAITQYHAMFGGNPVGNNLEITAELAGNNPKQINFIQSEAGMRINGNGELVDIWGTPLFFHQLSGSDTEVRSAGPDRKMWTRDDLVTR